MSDGPSRRGAARDRIAREARRREVREEREEREARAARARDEALGASREEASAPPPRTGEPRPIGRTGGVRDAARPVVRPELADAIREDVASPPPLLLLPLRLEYRVLERSVPIRLAGNIAAVVAARDDVTAEREEPRGEPRDEPRPETPGGPRRPPIGRPPREDRVETRPGSGGRAGAGARAEGVRGRAVPLDPVRVTFTTRREIWFRWYPDEDFSLRGIAPIAADEQEAIARFESATAGKPWHALDDPAVVSAWQALAREVAPERALHLLRHRDQPGDPDHLDAVGRIALLPERVALFALDALGTATLLAEGQPIDPELRYSVANLESGGWHTDFDAALAAGMGLRLTEPDDVTRALDASWIVAAGISKQDGVAAVTTLLDDAVANGAFAFLRQDTPTNNTPNEPTPYRSPRADVLSFLRTAADAEKGVLASPLTQSAELLAESLGIEVGHVANAPNSGDTALEDARAMLRVVGPALVDTSVDSVAALKGIAEEDLIELFADAIVARGPLPAVRFGKSPYGILPVTELATLQPLASDPATARRIESFVRMYAILLGAEAGIAADASVPVLRPGDPDAPAKLESILKLHPVSRRVEVGTVGGGEVRALGCAYVASPAQPVERYLADLARLPVVSLPDPIASDATFPLLYRLARLTLSKSTIFGGLGELGELQDLKVSTRDQLTEEEDARITRATSSIVNLSVATLASSAVPGVGGDRARGLRSASGRFLAGLQRLQAIAAEPDGVARLETLLMEAIDVFQHRIDAWATGLAYRRLVKRRRAGRTGLSGGYWGMLGRLRPDSVTGRTDGYLQAPTPHQAATAAILRSAHLRHRESGAFAIALSSARVRRGLELLDALRTGISLGEALGYIGERTLHDRRQDVLIFRLRDLFPLRDPRDDVALEIRLHDGLAFAGADIGTMVAAAEAEVLLSAQREVRDHLDALADIVLAEAAHLRAMGQAEGANAWLQVLSGETIPGFPSVLRTRRNGQGSSHRVAVLLQPVDVAADATANAGPREIAEPAVAALARERLTGFAQASVNLVVGRADGSGSDTLHFMVAADLGLKPMDLLVGGESELLLRARHRLVSLWRTDDGVRATLGSLPDRDVTSFLNRDRPVSVDLDAGAPSARALLRAAAELRRAQAQGRRLEPSDLSAAADPGQRLTDAVERDLLASGASALAARASALVARINPLLAALRAAAGAAVVSARNVRRLADDGADEAARAIALAELEALRHELDASMLAASWFAEPGALRQMMTVEMAADPDELERVVLAVVARLEQKGARLVAAMPPGAPPATAGAARALRDALVAALRGALDGDALPVLPPVPRTPATTPLLDAAAMPVVDALDVWSPVRAKVSRIAALFAGAEWRARRTTAAATGADDPDSDERDESVAPRARLFGTFVARGDAAAEGAFVGFVADEWAEQRPSRMQHTGLAINYDSPQSEPPHVLLLCEPSGPGAPAWSAAHAAAMVAETIGLMKARALASQDRPLSGPLLPFANRVPFKQIRGFQTEARIPARRLRPFPGDLGVVDGVFVVDETARATGISGRGISETSGFSKVED